MDLVKEHWPNDIQGLLSRDQSDLAALLRQLSV